MAAGSGHQMELCNGLWTLRDTQKYTDFVLVSELDGQEFHCHKVVLAAVSPYFDTLFNISMMEAETGRTELRFEGETIRQVLQYIYTGSDAIIESAESIPDLYYAANYLQLKTLQHACEDYLSKGTGYEISLEIWQIAKGFKNHQVAEVARSIVLKHFRSFCQVESIGRISMEDLKSLLQDKSVNCSGTIKCKAAWIWLVAKESPSVDIVKDLLNILVGSENVDSDDILTACSDDGDQVLEMIGHENIGKIEECRALWEHACKDLWIRAEPVVYGRERDLKDSLIIVGGTPANDSKLTVFDFKEKAWYNLKSQPCDLGHRYAICSLGSLLYLSGGTTNPSGFFCFDAETGVWQAQEALPCAREQHSMCTVPDNSIQTDQRLERKIYVLGGRSQQETRLLNIHVYSTRNRRWTNCGQVAYPVTAACSTVVDRRIYLLGGTNMTGSSRNPCETIQCFDTENGQSWTVGDVRLPFQAKALKLGVTCLASDKIAHQVFVLHERALYKLLLASRRQSIEKVAEIPDAPLKGFAVTSYGERVFIFGGEDNNFRIVRSVLQYDTAAGQVVTLPIQTPDKLKDFAYTYIPVPNSWDLTEMQSP